MSAALDCLDTIPGVARRSAEQIIAELGDDMRQFPTSRDAAAWTGICPGNHQSAGKRRHARNGLNRNAKPFGWEQDQELPLFRALVSQELANYRTRGQTATGPTT
jgi:hypothetical protein